MIHIGQHQLALVISTFYTRDIKDMRLMIMPAPDL